MNRGTTRIALALLPAALSTAPLSAQLPRADELVSRSIQAMGGAEVIRKHGHIYMVGTFQLPAQNINGSVEIWNSNNMMLFVVDIPGLGNIRSGYDGTTGWDIHPATGASVLSGRQLDQRAQEADLFAVLTPEKYIKSRETLEQTTFDGKAAYKVKTILLNGEEYFDLYDVKTNLAIGQIRTAETPMGGVETTTAYTDYKSFDGLLLPSRTRQAAMGMEFVITITKMDFAPIDATKFELPAEIKALIKK